MASISNITTARSMNGIITLTDGYATIENGNITSDNITTSNIITDDINLNLGNGRSLSVFDDLNTKAVYTDILSLSGIIYNNNISVISYENANTIYKYTISGNLNNLQNNLQNQINNCFEYGYNIMNSRTIISIYNSRQT